MKAWPVYEKGVNKVPIRKIKPGVSDAIMLIIFTAFAVLMVIAGSGCAKKETVQLTTIDETKLAAMEATIDMLTGQLLQLQTDNQGLSDNMALLVGQDTELQTQIDALDLSIASLLSQVATLNGYQHIVGFVDPCGNGPGHDELLIKLSTGKYLAHFSSGNLQFLTELIENVQYRTTDQQSCHFSIINGNLVY